MTYAFDNTVDRSTRLMQGILLIQSFITICPEALGSQPRHFRFGFLPSPGHQTVRPQLHLDEASSHVHRALDETQAQIPVQIRR